MCVLRTRTGNTPGDAQDPATILLRKCGIRNVNSPRCSSSLYEKIKLIPSSVVYCDTLVVNCAFEGGKKKKEKLDIFLNDE